jgi:hypothetical protein
LLLPCITSMENHRIDRLCCERGDGQEKVLSDALTFCGDGNGVCVRLGEWGVSILLVVC